MYIHTYTHTHIHTFCGMAHQVLYACRYGLEAIQNLYLLSHCQSFVGTFSSNFGRLAFELAYARFNGNVFSASMDVFWHAYP